MAENGIVRQPRAHLVIGDDAIPIMGFEARLVRSSGQQSTAQVTLALDDPDVPGPQFWSQGGLIPASIIATNGDAQKTTATILTGYIDYATVDFGTRTVTAEMCDNGRPLLDTRSDAAFTNQTTNAVVSQLAAQAGLNVVTLGPGTMAGTKDVNGQYVFNSDLESSWDVIQALAHQDGNVAFVIGNTLYYVPPGTPFDANYVVVYRPPNQNGQAYDSANTERLVCIHNFDLGQGVQYGVMSWNQSDNQPYTAMAGAGKYQGAKRVPNKTQQQVEAMAVAGQRYAQMHEYTCEVQMRGDVIVQPTMMLTLAGTQSAFDMTYYMYEVVHRMNVHDGYEMEITAYNSPQGDNGYVPDLPNIYQQLGIPQPGAKEPSQRIPQVPAPGFTMLTGFGVV